MIIITNHSSSKLPKESEKKYEQLFAYIVEGKPSEGDWMICTKIKNPTPQKCGTETDNGYQITTNAVTNFYTPDKESYVKIVKTSNPELITDGVASIFQPRKVEFTMDMIAPANLDEIPNYNKSYVMVVDGKVETEIDNEYAKIPKVVYLRKAGSTYSMYDHRTHKNKNVSPKDLVGLHEITDKQFGEFVDRLYDRMADGEEDAIEDYVREYATYPDIEGECDKILGIVERNQDVLCKLENMPFLAYIMLRWQNLYYAGRICFGYRECLTVADLGQCENNPKYEFEDIHNSEENQNVIYDAWGAGIGMEGILPRQWSSKILGDRVPQLNESDFDELAKYHDYHDDFTDLLHKKNKTMDDWYALLGNPKYRYHSIYESKFSIDNHLLCVIGNGYGWNKDGYLTQDGPSGEDETDYGKFPMMKGRGIPEIEAELNAILMQPHVQMCLDLAKVWHGQETVKHVLGDILRFGGISHLAIDCVYGRDRSEENPAHVKELIYEAHTRGYDEGAKIRLINVTDGSKTDIIKTCGELKEYKYDEEKDMLFYNEDDGKQGWCVYVRGSWCDVLDENGNVVELSDAQIKDMKKMKDLIKRVDSREERTPEKFKIAVKEAWESISDEHEKIASAMKEREILSKKIEEARVAAGGKKYKDMTSDEKMKLAMEKPKDKQYNAYEKIINDAIDKVEEIAKANLQNLTYDEILDLKAQQDEALSKIKLDRDEDEEKRKGDYYPLSSYSRIIKPPKNVHPSYIKAGIHIMEEIIGHSEALTKKFEEQEKNSDNKQFKNRVKGQRSTVKENVERAKKWLAKYGPEKYAKWTPVFVDYEKMFKEYRKLLKPSEATFTYVDGKLNNGAPKPGAAMFYRIDKEEDDYSERDQVIGYWNVKGMDFPKVIGDRIELIKDTSLYQPIADVMSRAIQVDGVKQFDLSIDTVTDPNNPNVQLHIVFNVDGESWAFKQRVDAKMRELGFMLGKNAMALELDEVILVTRRAETLGLNHPDNEDGTGFFSHSQFFDVYDKNWKKLGGFNIDERGFNTFSGMSHNKKLNDWLYAQHNEMKASDPAYGEYDSSTNDRSNEGKRNLYAHDFMLWLKDHQMQLIEK